MHNAHDDVVISNFIVSEQSLQVTLLHFEHLSIQDMHALCSHSLQESMEEQFIHAEEYHIEQLTIVSQSAHFDMLQTSQNCKPHCPLRRQYSQ